MWTWERREKVEGEGKERKEGKDYEDEEHTDGSSALGVNFVNKLVRLLVLEVSYKKRQTTSFGRRKNAYSRS